jgi:guanylate kinase
MGQIITLQFFSFFIFGPLQELGNIIIAYREAETSLHNFEKLMNTPVEPKPLNPIKIDQIETLDFENISFKHHTARQCALNEISFSVKRGESIAFVGPSGSGKTTIVRHLLGIPDLNLEFSVSCTTRAPRGTEVHGKDYYYINIADFKQHIKAEDFVEWEEVYRDNFYGTLKSEVERIWASGKNVIFDIDVAGGLRIKKKFPEQTLAVFVKPPSVDELKRRLKERSTETDEKINMRIAKAHVELATAPQFDKIIKNYDLDTAKQEAVELVRGFVGGD